MTAKRKKRQVKEGQILEGWKNATQGWKFKKGKKFTKNIKKVLEIILEDEGEIDENIENWKKFLTDFNDVENRKEKYSGKTESPKYGLILICQKVCEQLRTLFSETKKVTHGDLYLINEIPGMDEGYQRLYIDGEDKRYIPASKAYEIIKKLNDALLECKWTSKQATNSAIDPSTKDLEWWSD
jgi:vacuolar-type H+-ATPase subunit F/Vma7